MKKFYFRVDVKKNKFSQQNVVPDSDVDKIETRVFFISSYLYNIFRSYIQSWGYYTKNISILTIQE